jgi:hypothetical protein
MQSAHTATCAPIYKYRRSPPCHGRAHTHTPARTHTPTCMHANARTHARAPSHSARKHATWRNAESRARTDSNGAHVQPGSRAVPPRRVGANVGSGAGGEVATADRMRARAHRCIFDIVRNQAMRWRAGIRNSSHGATAYRTSPYIRRSTRQRTRTHTCVSTDGPIHLRTHTRCVQPSVCEQGGCDRGNARGMGGRDLGASAGTQSHAQQSRAAPLGRRVAFECAAEPRRHPSLVQRRFLPLRGFKGGIEGVLS